MVLSCSDFSFVLAKESVKEVILEFNFFWILPHANKKKRPLDVSIVFPFPSKTLIKWVTLFMSKVLVVLTVILKHPW